MRTVLATISVILQAVYVVGLLTVFQYFVRMLSIDWTWFDADPRLIAAEQYLLLIDFGLMAAAGLLGIAFAWFVLRLEKFRPAWFVFSNRVLALAWFVFFPLGTLIAVFMLRWCKGDARGFETA